MQRLGQKCREMLEDAIGEQRVLLRYYEANSHAGIYAIKSIDTAYAWGWNQPEAIAEVLALRQAIREPAFDEVHDISRCRIRTNLGVRLNSLGQTDRG